MNAQTHDTELLHLDCFEPRIVKPSINADPIPVGALPITEDEARRLFADTGVPYEESFKPVSSETAMEHFEKRIIPALAHLGFMGVNPLPDIRVLADWSKTDNEDIADIEYPAFIFPDFMEEDELEHMLDVSLLNGLDGELPMTLGRIPLAAFSALFSTWMVAVDKSTSAHRRYKDKFTGQHIRFILHADYNHVEAFANKDLFIALDDAIQCFMHGR